MKRWLQWLFASICMFGMLSAAPAALTLNVNQGVDKPFTLALVPFSGQTVTSSQAPDGVEQVIDNDLAHSGRFTIKQQGLPETPNDAESIHWDDWQSDYILLGHITQSSGQGYDVTYQLATKATHQVISARRFKDVAPSQFRQLGHQISNYIFKAVTGHEGYFTSKIAYVNVSDPYDSSHAVYRLIVSDYDGANSQVILEQTGNPIASPTWSPDGKSLAFVTYYEGGMAIYRIRINDGYFQLLSNYPGINSSPAWSPDGKTLAVALSQGQSDHTDLYLMNLKNQRLYKKFAFSGSSTAPAWSPDGQKIAFTSNQDGNPQVFMLDMAKGESQRLSPSNTFQSFDPSFAPNGHSIVFMQEDNKGDGTHIVKMNLDSHQITQLSHGDMDASPSVAPGGQMVLYSAGGEDQGHLAMVSINGKIRLTLPKHFKGVARSPSWSPINFN